MKNEEFDKQPIMVSIRCLVYNHEPYLRQCLEGFVMQQTDFRFEAIVHDDVSTDRSAEIIREYAEKYPEIIKPIFETENQYSKFDGSISRIMRENIRGKYVAYCEGDDCWTDPLKLQKQVSFLEAHPEYSASHTDIDYEYVGTGRVLRQKHRHMKNYCLLDKDFTFRQMAELILSGKYSIQTLSVCARRDYLDAIQEECKELQSANFKMGDTPLWIELSQRGKIHYLPESTATYHIIEESATHSKNYSNVINFCKSCFYMVDYFGKRYHLPDKQLAGIKNEYAYFLLREVYISKMEYMEELRTTLLQGLKLNKKNRLMTYTITLPSVLKKLILFSIKIEDRLAKRWDYYGVKFLGYKVTRK